MQLEEEVWVVRRTVVRRWGEGDQRWFLNTWSAVAVDAATTCGAFDVVTRDLPAGYSPPWHRHDGRDEVLVVVEGEVDLECQSDPASEPDPGGARGPGGQRGAARHVDRWRLGPGAVAHVPRGAGHSLTVGLGGPAKVVVISTPGGLAALVAELGAVVPTDLLPALAAPDLAGLAAAGARHDLHLLDPSGPPDGYAAPGIGAAQGPGS